MHPCRPPLTSHNTPFKHRPSPRPSPHCIVAVLPPSALRRPVILRDRFLVCLKQEWDDMKAHVEEFRQPHKSPDVPSSPQGMFDPVVMSGGPKVHKR